MAKKSTEEVEKHATGKDTGSKGPTAEETPLESTETETLSPAVVEPDDAVQPTEPTDEELSGSDLVVLKHHSVTAGMIDICGVKIPWTGVEVTRAKAEEVIAFRTAQFERRAKQQGRKPDGCDIYVAVEESKGQEVEKTKEV